MNIKKELARAILHYEEVEHGDHNPGSLLSGMGVVLTLINEHGISPAELQAAFNELLDKYQEPGRHIELN